MNSTLDFFQHPATNIILMMLILGGLIAELKAPGKLFPLLTSLLATAGYLTPYYFMGTVETWELFLFLFGFVLLLMEIFVIPGFGLTGITGFVALFTSLALVTLHNHYLDFSEVTDAQILRAVVTSVIGAMCSMVMLLIMAHFMTNSAFFNKVALQTSFTKAEGYHIENKALLTLVGQKGVVYNKLRPVGKILVNENIYEATSKNKFFDMGQVVKVVAVNGNTLIVEA
jgi:membrane-bound serine protease (ClpP class)